MPFFRCQKHSHSPNVLTESASLGLLIQNIELRPRQNGCSFVDDNLKCIIFNKNVWIFIQISLKFAPHVRMDNKLAFGPVMATKRGQAIIWTYDELVTDAYKHHTAWMS